MAGTDIAALWPRLTEDTRDWLVEHNGEPLPDDVLADLRAASGGADGSWLAEEGDDGLHLTDEAVDWVEATANGE